MKYLYMWNDIPLFDSVPSEPIEKKIEELFQSIELSTKCKYILIKDTDYQKWVDELNKNYMGKNFITVGTRPSLVKLPSISNREKISLERGISSDGHTEGLKFLGNSELVLKDWLRQFKEIHFVEDVCVGGGTLECICNYFHDNGYKGKIIFHVFAANSQAMSDLDKDWGFNLEIKSNILMEEKPIEGSTMLCCYDLIYNKLGDKYYRERTDLLELFFFENVNKLIELIEWMEIYIHKNRLNRRSI